MDRCKHNAMYIRIVLYTVGQKLDKCGKFDDKEVLGLISYVLKIGVLRDNRELECSDVGVEIKIEFSFDPSSAYPEVVYRTFNSKPVA